ncbi:tail fiber assembly protein [Pseudomonas allokribbensis]|uniref:tail fiber assembly protein n=1 Tax=Pseudomonas allokribbensis TaxID=2774460 RepID=UPI001788811C|nr:tail fiber assembly protein [Pseudomonas allokribbensis]
MNRYAFVPTFSQTSFLLVTHVLDTEGGAPTTSPDGVQGNWHDVTAYSGVQVGWKVEYFFDKGLVFTELTYEDHLTLASIYMQQRFDETTRRLMFNPLQCKVDLGIATPADEAALITYKRYIIAVSEVVNQPGYPSTINWPATPY